ncbi:hypothetical protein SDC9_187143 [bioreactor metagenome]|uniref:Uncharacterized protein n=1 Tax=bioreactor metagenome TaxID=1076179 RepID=A0A645HKQ9_9ZZZZ
MLDKNPDIVYIKGDAVFPYSTLVHDNGSHNDPYTANQIWFTDDELSLYYNSKNKDITMSANLFAFWGNIEFEDGCTFQIEPCPNDPGEGYAPLITGQTLSGYGYEDVINTDYGLVYFGPGVSCAGVELGGENGQFYFFPKDIDLGALDDDEERDKLLLVEDFNIFNVFKEPVGMAFASSPISLSIGGAVQ